MTCCDSCTDACFDPNPRARLSQLKVSPARNNPILGREKCCIYWGLNRGPLLSLKYYMSDHCRTCVKRAKDFNMTINWWIQHLIFKHEFEAISAWIALKVRPDRGQALTDDYIICLYADIVSVEYMYVPYKTCTVLQYFNSNTHLWKLLSKIITVFMNKMIRISRVVFS